MRNVSTKPVAVIDTETVERDGPARHNQEVWNIKRHDGLVDTINHIKPGQYVSGKIALYKLESGVQCLPKLPLRPFKTLNADAIQLRHGQ